MKIKLQFKNGKLSKVTAIILSAFIALTGCSSNVSEEAESHLGEQSSKTLKIGITQIADHPSLNAARDGFIERMKELEIETEISLQDAQGDTANAQLIAEKFVSDKVDLILSIATATSQAAQNATLGTNIPVIFTAVSDPKFSGLVENPQSPEANVTGVTDNITDENLKELFAMLEQLDKEISTIGIVFNTGESNSQVQVENVKRVASQEGFNVETVGIAAITDINQALESLTKKSQALVLINDNMVASSMELVSKIAKEKGIPTVSADGSHVDSGALISAGISFFELGRQSADIAKSILIDKTPISEIPVQGSNVFVKKVNLTTLKSLGLDEKSSVFEGAEVVQ